MGSDFILNKILIFGDVNSFIEFCWNGFSSCDQMCFWKDLRSCNYSDLQCFVRFVGKICEVVIVIRDVL